MKVVFLFLSFLATIFLIRLFAIQITKHYFIKKRKEKQDNKNNEVFIVEEMELVEFEKNKKIVEEFIEIKNQKHNDTNIDSKAILSGTIDYNDKQNLHSVTNKANVYRAKNGRFASKKKELSNV
jgi:predicted membrane protein